jgi:uncharacterized protein YjlB
MCSAKQVKRLNGRREDHFFRRDWVPNNQRLPVVIHKFLQARPLRTISRTCSPQTDGQTFGGMAFSTTSIIIPGAHEVLGVGQGSGTVLIGAPDGWVIKVATVDCLILPAGTGHMNLGCSPDFEVVGAYPAGQRADMQISAHLKDMLAEISVLAVPDTDPVQGSWGPLTTAWP